LSSRTEGTPMVLFEAMATGTAIIATRVGGVPDVLNDEAAWLVPSEDPAAVADALRAARANPIAREDRARRASRCLAENFSIDPWVSRYVEVYRTAMTKVGA